MLRRRVRAVRVAAIVVIAVVGSLLSAPASASAVQWNFETLDGAGGPDGRLSATLGSHTATTVWNGEPHVWYHDVTNGDLRHTWWNGTRWLFETLDGNSTEGGRVTATVGLFVDVTVWNREPHVWYFDATGGNLRHGWWNGATWLFETLDGNSTAGGRVNATVGYDSAVTVWSGEPHVWYYDLSNGNLRHAWWNGATWLFETLDGAGGVNGRLDAMLGTYGTATVWSGEPHVWYFDVTNGNLRHAWWNGSAWFFETLDGAGGVNGRVAGVTGWFSTVTVWDREPHVWYHDATNGDLRHAWWNGSAWLFETLDGNSTVNGRTDGVVGLGNTATVWNREPHVWSYDDTDGNLRHAWWNGSTWNFETLDGNSTVNGRIDAMVGNQNSATVWRRQPHVWYLDLSNSDLRHAFYG